MITDSKIDTLLKTISKKVSKKTPSEFVDLLYREVSSSDLAELTHEHLACSAESMFKLLQKRKPNESKVNLFQSTANDDYVVLEVINKNVPFLLDSIGNELKNNQYDIHLIVHPSFKVERDKAGNFIKFGEKGEKEDVVQIHLGNWFDSKKLVEIKDRIEKILECVNYSVSDWRTMTGKMTVAIDHLLETPTLRQNDMRDESVAFLQWLVDNHMVFLAYYETEISGNKLVPIPNSELGLIKSDLYSTEEMELDENLKSSDPLLIRKWDERSVVHRLSHLDLIVIKKFDSKGKCVGAYNFLGLFTSTVYYQSVREIPLMRKKVAQVIRLYGYPESSHNCKELITAMESFPRGELLRMSMDELYDTATGIVSLVLAPRVRVFIRKDSIGKFMSVITFIPEKRFSTETRNVIENIICKHLHGTVSKRYVFVGESLLTRLQLIVKVDDVKHTDVNVERLEKDIVRAISIWSDELSESLIKSFGKRSAIVAFNKYKDAFDIKYRSIFTGKQAVHDMKFIEDAINNNKVCFDIYISQKTGGRDYTQLKIYSPDRELPLSATLPALENFGFYGVDEITYPITIPNATSGNTKLFIHHFRLLPKTGNLNVTQALHDNIVQAAHQIWARNIDNDRFNSLIVYVNATWREAVLVRAYFSYLKLTDFPFSPDFSLGILLEHTEITRKIIELFNTKFDISLKPRKGAEEVLCSSIEKLLNEIKGIEEDKVCRSFYQVVKATKRTNFYQKDAHGNYKDYVSFKISSQELDVLPKPKPYAEVYVYSRRVEAIHLRGGKVARGGLRWSDRKEDFRTEVLGLMKAQMTKNSVIVPVGSKGGFIVKTVSPTDGREEYLKEGIECYKTFLSGILDITDNIVNSKIVPPKDVIRLDGDDPYLVVAADKGTATFSDYANSVSEKYGFWLGDAFASGGSAGYDHKKMGITAKGGWISVVRHFNDMGINIEKEAFTCVGIGDLAGDVFGNGMILSDNIKLIAAFNHMHIFIDPNPDTKKSFAERKRMFNLPRSAWTDYDSKLISKGGGIYERKQKTITLSNEAKAALDLKESTWAPDQLIKEILQAPVDLLWNGGIGTYVKAKTESNDKIGDKANDALRVNGEELRCKIIGEGGNLGMTQLGRIEYAKNGGRLNTDFIDNSAGVDCSDHEVNLKIATSDELLSKRLSKADRDKFLNKMTDDVSDLVLMDNIKQTQLITIESMAKNSKINAHAWLIKHLESKGELDRKIEYLPDQTELMALIADKQSLTRPETAVLVAYAKNSIYSSLSKHIFNNSKNYDDYLFSYFPKAFQEKFPKLINNHKLKNEILATVLTNDLVNTLGSTFFHQFKEETGAETYKIINAYVVVKKIFGISEQWGVIEKLNGKVPLKLQLELFTRVQTLIERNIAWLIKHHYKELDNVDALIESYQKSFLLLRSKVLNLATPQMLEDYEQNLAKFKDYPDLVNSVKGVYQTKLCRVAFDIISLTRETNTKLEDTAKLYYDLGDKTYISWLLYQARNFYGKQYYQNVAIRALISELYEIQMSMVQKEISGRKKTKSSKYLVISNDNFLKFEYFINDLKASGELAESMVAMLTIAVKRVRELV